ncbi:MAG: glycosyltransferase family 4 protein [Clostridiales bacterium]|nr:glycosyltransferase family 4 protein [Clostridiales bacterium]
MKILFLDAYYEPERIAFTHLEKDLLQGLVNARHEVEIICPTPTRGVSKELSQKYRKIKNETTHNGKVNISRFYAPSERKNPILRALRYFWCNVRTYQIGKSRKDIDAFFANSTPPTQGWIGGIIANRLNVPFIYSLQDVFPDSLVATGLATQDSLLFKVGRKLEKSTYEKCHSIIVISNTIEGNLERKGVEKQKVHVVSNWIDIEEIEPVSRLDNKLFDEYGIDRNKFIVLYAGIIGSAQGADIIIEVAKRLEENKGIQFVIFGGGSEYELAKEKAHKLSNVIINPLLPQERISEVYSMGDVSIITCKKGVGMAGMPSKTWSIMACNTPIIASFDKNSELERILNEASCGVVVDPENCDALLNEISKFYSSKKEEKTYGREYVMKHASKDACVSQYITIMEKSVVQ